MKEILAFTVVSFFATITVFGQVKIGDNPQTINASSVLELESNSKVLVITRVTTQEMNAITPNKGGLVYNLDEECIHYYNGNSWVNLCALVNFKITNEPIDNKISTISVLETPEGYNLEVAKKSIAGSNIIDGSIGSGHIQKGAINQEKIAKNAVGVDQLSDNSVDTDKIKDRSIKVDDIADSDFPHQVIITDENNTAKWVNTEELFELKYNATNNTLQIVRSETPGVSSIQLPTEVDGDIRNELQDLAFNEIDKTLTLTNPSTVGASVNLSSIAPQFQNSTSVTFAGTGTTADPYILTSTGGGGSTTTATITTAINTLTTSLRAKENTANKSTDGTLIDNSDDDYPTEKAVKTYVDTQITNTKNMSNSNLTLTGPRTHNLGLNNFNLSGAGSVGIGNNNPQNKLHVSGEVRSEGYNSSQGTAEFPAYSFSTGADSNTGMYRPAADQLGFSAGGIEALRIEETTRNTNVIINQSLQVNNLLLDKDGEPGTAGQILSTTGTQTDWIDSPSSSVQIMAMGKYNANTESYRANGINSITKNSTGNYTVTLTTPRPTADYIIQLTLSSPVTLSAPGASIQVTDQNTNSFTVQISELTDAIESANGLSGDFNGNLVIIGGNYFRTQLNPADANWYFTVSDFN